MVRTLPVCAVLLALAPAARTQEKAKVHEEVIRLTVHPAAAPRPALKYQLLPEYREMNPGNPILGYLRCFSEQQGFFFNNEVVAQRDKWLEMPLKDLPVKELRYYGRIPLGLVDYAARLDTPDWQILPRMKQEGLGTLVPDLQQMRTLAAALHVRFRGAVADRRFDDALTSAKTMFALARHAGRHPTLVGNLVGTAIAMITIDPVDEMLQLPNCPNLFWALADMPQPFIEMRPSIQGDRLILAREFRFLNEKVPMTEARVKKAAAKFQEMISMIGPPASKFREKGAVQKWLDRLVNDEPGVRAARKRLTEFGLTERTVKEFPPLQVVLLDLKLTFEEARDDMIKILHRPYAQMESFLETWRRKGSQENLLNLLAPAMLKVRIAQVRLEQRFGLLRHVEALRLYAAQHDRQLPKQLSDIKLPLPVDPVTGRPFRYTLDGATATVEGSPITGLMVRYVVSLTK